MKAVLVCPPSSHMITTNVPEVVDEETGCYPPLGLLSIAAYARERTNWEVAVIDALVEGIAGESLKRRIEDEEPDVVGIQCMTFTLIDVIETARLVRRIDPSIHICLGGPHVNIYPDETIALEEVDSLVLGEGEITFAAFLASFGDRSALRRVPGLVYREGSEVARTGPPALIEDLNALPFPARDLVPYRKYYSLLGRERPITTMMTSRGCPHRCIFCDRPHLGKRFRARSASSVVAEMQECVRLGIRELFFYDDTFSIDRRRIAEVCEEIGRLGVSVAWDIRARVNTVDRDLLGRLREAGCVRIHFGVEAGNAAILKSLRKGITREQARRAFTWAREAGITTLAYFMVGSPGEGEREVMESIRFAQELEPDYVHFSVTTPFPATELYRLALERGVITRDLWREFAARPTPDFVPPLWEENFDREELIAYLHLAYQRFYSRPSYIVKQLLRVRSWHEFRRKARAGLRVISLGSRQ